ncbi:hypothetical protein Tco_0517684, partial [Tanacetum coccineum]
SFNLLVYSFRALSTLRRSGLRTTSAAAKPCQGDSLEVYLITVRIPTVAAAGQRNVTPLFESMLVQPTEDEGEDSERQSEPQPTPSPPHPSIDQHETQPNPSPKPSPTIPIPNSIPEGSGGNHGAFDDLEMWKYNDAIYYMETDAYMQRELELKIKLVPSSQMKYNKATRFSTRQKKNPEVSNPKPNEVEVVTKQLDERPRASINKISNYIEASPKIDPKRQRAKKYLMTKNYVGEDEEIARKVQEDWEAEEEMKKLAEEEATKAALIQDFDDIQARIEADRLLAARLQEEERETFIVEERTKFLYDTIAAQRRFLAQQRAAAIKNRPLTRTQLRNQKMTYLKHVGGKKHHADLKNKNFEEIQVLYKKVKRSDKDFIAIGSAEDERQIKEMNEESKDPKKKRVINEIPREEDIAKVPAKQEVTKQGTKKRKSGHVKMIARKRPRPQPDDDSDDEHRKCLRIVTFESTIDSEIMETKSFVSKLHKVSSPDGDYLVVYRVNGHFRAFNYLMEVLHIFDRQDLFHLYDLVMKQYSEITPEGIELILWGDLKIMMESSTEENDQGDFWNNQQEWEVFRWRLYEACGVCILELKDGTVIHMLVERRYPLSKELLQRMLDLGLEVEEESTAALHLVRFIKQQLNEE